MCGKIKVLMMNNAMIIALFLFAISVDAQYEGDSCTKDGIVGVCINIRQCPPALEDLKNRKQPQNCGFGGRDPIVCCVQSGGPVTVSQPVLTTTKRSPITTTTEYVPPEYTYVDVYTDTGTGTSDRVSNDGCEPVPDVLTSKKTGQKAWDKCIEYQERLVFPCGKCQSILGGMCRSRRCHHNADELIIGGVDAEPNEFPHMALLAYGDDPNNLQWLCGGTLISEKFILTAGHCIASREGGNVSYVQLGTLLRSSMPLRHRYRVKTVHKYPQYVAPIKYHDIALLELDREVPLDEYLVPACIHTGGASVNVSLASATGWGLTEYNGKNSDRLQKVILTKFDDDFECAFTYAPGKRHLLEGFDRNTQSCYGDRTKSRDTCQGDSGGPLQIKSKSIACMYVVVGITSFGDACGFVGVPGMYTRVEHYVSWIESIVWP